MAKSAEKRKEEAGVAEMEGAWGCVGARTERISRIQNLTTSTNQQMGGSNKVAGFASQNASRVGRCHLLQAQILP